jgi:LssY-like putative type I secretion system component LssY
MDWHPNRRRGFQFLGVVAFLYLVLAYLALPALWRHHEHEPGLAELPMVTRTSTGIPGDALNVGLVGSQEDVLRAMQAAGWFPADPVTLRTSLAIVGSVVLDRPYPRAPVSPLFYDGRREDLAFERSEGESADRRHHVRFWKVLRKGQEGRSVWLGAATFDRGVGFNRFNGQFTHHIGADIDAERDFLTEALKSAQVVEAVYEVTGIGPTLNGVNGEGDPYHTDGEIKVSRLVEGCGTHVETPLALTNPPVIDLKNFVWENVVDALLSLRSPRASQDSE